MFREPVGAVSKTMTIGSEQHLYNNDDRNQNQYARLDVHHCYGLVYNIPVSCGLLS